MRFLSLLAVTVLSGCASLPDATVQYWLPKAVSTVEVVETYACKDDDTDFAVVSLPSISTSYVADKSSGTPQTVYLKDLDSFYASGSAAFTFTEDGRLKSLNATSTGVGGEMVKAVVGIVTGVRTGAVSLIKPPICDVVAQFGDPKSQTLTVTRVAKFDHKLGGEAVFDIVKDPALNHYVRQRAESEKKKPDELGLFTQLTLSKAAVQSPASGTIDQRINMSKVDKPKLVVNQVRRETLLLRSKKPGGEPVDLASFEPLVPGPTYEVQIPKPIFFGEQILQLALSDAGQITGITYNNKAGSGIAAEALNQIYSAANPPVTLLVAEEKARADLIAHQQRLALCLADRKTCKP